MSNRLNSVCRQLGNLVLVRKESTQAKPVYKRFSRGRTRKERRYSGVDPAWMEYREELRSLRHEWIQQRQKDTEAQQLLEEKKLAREEEESREKAVRIEASLKEQEEVVQDFGLDAVWPTQIPARGMQLKDVVAMMDKADDLAPNQQSPQDLIEGRKMLWKKFVEVRRKARHANYLATEEINSDSRLSNLLWMYYQSDDWVTPENLDRKIDAVFQFEGSRAWAGFENNYRNRDPFEKMITSSLSNLEKSRSLAIQDALNGTITKPIEVSAMMTQPKGYPDVHAVKQRLKEEAAKEESEPRAPSPKEL